MKEKKPVEFKIQYFFSSKGVVVPEPLKASYFDQKENFLGLPREAFFWA